MMRGRLPQARPIILGTNYYLYYKPCQHCGLTRPARHIGKSSGGWCFALHVYPDEGIKDLDDWEGNLFAAVEAGDGEIRDEYGRDLTIEELMSLITGRAWESGTFRAADWYSWNHAVPGPNGLARSKLGRNCIGHGKGTWDLITGEFS